MTEETRHCDIYFGHVTAGDSQPAARLLVAMKSLYSGGLFGLYLKIHRKHLKVGSLGRNEESLFRRFIWFVFENSSKTLKSGVSWSQ